MERVHRVHLVQLVLLEKEELQELLDQLVYQEDLVLRAHLDQQERKELPEKKDPRDQLAEMECKDLWVSQDLLALKDHLVKMVTRVK